MRADDEETALDRIRPGMRIIFYSHAKTAKALSIVSTKLLGLSAMRRLYASGSNRVLDDEVKKTERRNGEGERQESQDEGGKETRCYKLSY